MQWPIICGNLKLNIGMTSSRIFHGLIFHAMAFVKRLGEKATMKLPKS